MNRTDRYGGIGGILGVLAAASFIAAPGHRTGPGERTMPGGTRMEVEPTRATTSQQKSQKLKNLLAK